MYPPPTDRPDALAASTPASRRTPLGDRVIRRQSVSREPTLELVDSDHMASALAQRWRVGTDCAQDLLLLDPAGLKGSRVMAALADTTGAPLSSIRLLSPAGLRELAWIEELRMPAGPGLPRCVRSLQTRRFEHELPSPALSRLWQQTRVGALMLDHLPPDLASHWLLGLSTLVRRLGDDGPNWVIYGPQRRPPPEPPPGGPTWMHKLHFQPPLSPVGLSASPASVWNAVLQAWDALH